MCAYVCVYACEKENDREGGWVGGEDKKQGEWECVRENGGRVKPINALRMVSVEAKAELP